MKTYTTLNFLLIGLLSLLVTACSSAQVFVKKPGATEAQFFQDKMYCQAGASGQSQDATKGERLIPYAECMLNLGYKKQP